jgi:HEAT repeat protein
MEATKNLVLSSLQNQSASSRIGAVKASYQMSTMDDEIVEALINTMNTDKNANVRLAAVDALSEFSDEEAVRKALIKSLTTQDKAVVQIALINLMVRLKEHRAIEPMKQIMQDENSIEVVKDEANYGVFKLS